MVASLDVNKASVSGGEWPINGPEELAVAEEVF